MDALLNLYLRTLHPVTKHHSGKSRYAGMINVQQHHRRQINTAEHGDYAPRLMPIKRELFANILDAVTPFQVQEQAPFTVREEVMDPTGLAAEDPMFAPA